MSGAELGLGVGSKLLQSLRQQVVMLAVSKGVLTTVKDAAKGTLSSGWSLLLPTTEERAKTLSELLAEKLGKFVLDTYENCSDRQYAKTSVKFSYRNKKLN